MRIAILYICTGKYKQFFRDFYESAEKYFLNGKAEKDYYVFTDDMELTKEPNVHLFYKKYEGFPIDSLFRFDMFLRVKDEILSRDYTFFFNSNMLFVAPVGKEILPDNFAAVIHPGYYWKPACLYPFERNKLSTAYIAPHQGNYKYYMGSFNGGTTKAFIAFAEECAKRTHDDYNRGIIASVHDESHLNKYMRDVNGQGLSPEYAYPEDWNLPFTPKIIIRDKAKLFPDNPDFNKGRKSTLWARFCKAGHILISACRWYLYI